jgi:cytoskeletal protein CcmA (bactofilin family)
MVNSNFSPQDKKPGDLILSADWNAAMSEIKRLEKAKLNREGADTFKGTLTIQEALNVTSNVKISGNLQLDAEREIIFTDNGQIKSADNNHRIIFRRKEDKLELREYGDIVFSPGANKGEETAKVVLKSNGNLGIGINPPAYTLDVNGSVRLGGFTGNDVDEWPKVVWCRDTNTDWDEGLIKHSSTRGVFNRAGYGIHLHQSRQFGLWSTGWNPLFAVRGGTGDAYLRGNLGIGSNPAQDKLDVAGNLRILSNTNPIRFTSSWSGFPDPVTNQAEICNDTGNYKTLMIVGNKSAGGGRRVSVWDKLEVNGDLNVTGQLEVNGRIKSNNTRSQVTANDSVNTKSKTWEDMPKMSVNVTTGNSPVLVLFKAGGVQCTDAPNDNKLARARFKLLIDNVDKATTIHEFNQNGWELRDVTLHFLDTLTAGSHTIKIQWYIETGVKLTACWYGDLRSLIVIEL